MTTTIVKPAPPKPKGRTYEQIKGRYGLYYWHYYENDKPEHLFYHSSVGNVAWGLLDSNSGLPLPYAENDGSTDLECGFFVPVERGTQFTLQFKWEGRD